MDIEKLIERLRDAGWTNPGLTDKQSLEWDAVDALEKIHAEVEYMKACVYYRFGGLCAYEGFDPAIVCVLGPCSRCITADEILCELRRAKVNGGDKP